MAPLVQQIAEVTVTINCRSNEQVLKFGNTYFFYRPKVPSEAAAGFGED